MFNTIVTFIFGYNIKDMLSGYRVFSHRYVKSFPSLSRGFEIEIELTIHSLELQMPVSEIKTIYKNRPEGSKSKLNTIRDGIRILIMIIKLIISERPFQILSIISILFGSTSIIMSIPLIQTYIETGLVPRFPTTVLVSGMMVISFLLFLVGLILNSITRGRREMKRLSYLQYNFQNPKKADKASYVIK
tara:strand:- start:284 stop:850 length:567 start_codon:yes stop_codon:yes gene_type:complete